MSETRYLSIMESLIHYGDFREGRNGGTYSRFGNQMRWDLAKGFPLLTTKKVHLKSIIVELLWFLRGDTNIQFLHDHNVTIWDEWADENGELGPVYGRQWRSYRGIDEFGGQVTVDQLKWVIDEIKRNPYSRRLLVSSWNPAEVDRMALPPCHCTFQFYVSGGKLSCQLYQRSADWFLGVPFNIASYALLTMLIARECGLGLGEFIHTFGDYHLYGNHKEQALIQIERLPRALPFMDIVAEPEVGIFDLKLEHFKLSEYAPHPAIKALVSA